MDFYKKKRLGNILLAVLFIVGIVLQFIGHRNESFTGLLIQLISLTFIVLVLFMYNRRHR